jgi:hypothetical protein
LIPGHARRLRTARADLIRDDAGKIALAEKDRAIAAAVLRYSEDRPQDKVQDVTPASANLLPLPAAWEADFSTLRSLEYPIGNVPPTYIDQDATASTARRPALQIQTDDAVQVAANTVRAAFTIKHVLDAGTDTIPLQHRQAVASLAGAICCRQLAAFYSSGRTRPSRRTACSSSRRRRVHEAREGARRRST